MDREDFNDLVSLLGEEKAKELVKSFKGSRVYFSIRDLNLHDRRELIYRLYTQHIPVAQIARRVGYSLSHTYSIIHDLKQ